MSLKAAIYAGCSKVAARRKGLGLAWFLKPACPGVPWKTKSQEPMAASCSLMFRRRFQRLTLSSNSANFASSAVKVFGLVLPLPVARRNEFQAPVYAACSNVAAGDNRLLSGLGVDFGFPVTCGLL